MGKEKILILEDEKLIRWSIREMLERDGYAVLEAATGKEALSLLDD